MPMMHANPRAKAWRQCFIFFAILLVLIQAVSLLPVRRAHEKNLNYWPYFYRELPRNSVDIVYMGNSHSNTTFIPAVIDDLLGTRSVHVNTSGESIHQTLFEYREVLRRQQPRMVVMETFPIYDGLTQAELKAWNYSFFFAMPFSFRKYLYAQQFFSEENLLGFYLPFTLFHADWKDAGGVWRRTIEGATDLFQDALTRQPVELPFGGYVNYFHSLPQDQVSQQTPDSSQCPLSDLAERLTTVEEILSIDRESGGSLIFLESPQFINPMAGCRSALVTLITSQGVGHQVLLEGQAPSPLWFGDEEHLTQSGALLASVQTAQILSERLGLPIDPATLSFYQQYFFKNYELAVASDQLTVSLVPYEADAPAGLTFSWTLERDEAKVDEFTGLGSNKASFALPDQDGDYSISFVVHDAEQKFYLRGGFIFRLEGKQIIF